MKPGISLLFVVLFQDSLKPVRLEFKEGDAYRVTVQSSGKFVIEGTFGNQVTKRVRRLAATEVSSCRFNTPNRVQFTVEKSIFVLDGAETQGSTQGRTFLASMEEGTVLVTEAQGKPCNGEEERHLARWLEIVRINPPDPPQINQSWTAKWKGLAEWFGLDDREAEISIHAILKERTEQSARIELEIDYESRTPDLWNKVSFTGALRMETGKPSELSLNGEWTRMETVFEVNRSLKDSTLGTTERRALGTVRTDGKDLRFLIRFEPLP